MQLNIRSIKVLMVIGVLGLCQRRIVDWWSLRQV